MGGIRDAPRNGQSSDEEAAVLTRVDRLLLTMVVAWNSDAMESPGPVFQDLVRREKRKPWWRYAVVQAGLVIAAYLATRRASPIMTIVTQVIIALGVLAFGCIRVYAFMNGLIRSGTFFHLLLTPLRLKDVVRDMRLAVSWLVARDCGFVLPLLGIVLKSAVLLFLALGYMQAAIYLGVLFSSGALSSPRLATRVMAAIMVLLATVSVTAMVLPAAGVLVIGSFVVLVSAMLLATNIQYEVIERLEENIQNSAVNLAQRESGL